MGVFIVWDTEGKTLAKRAKSHSNAVDSLQFLTGGKRLLSGSEGETTFLKTRRRRSFLISLGPYETLEWDLSTGKSRRGMGKGANRQRG